MITQTIKALVLGAALPFVYLIGRESVTTLNQLIRAFQAIEADPLGSAVNVDALANQFELLVIQYIFLIIISLTVYYLVTRK